MQYVSEDANIIPSTSLRLMKRTTAADHIMFPIFSTRSHKSLILSVFCHFSCGGYGITLVGITASKFMIEAARVRSMITKLL